MSKYIGRHRKKPHKHKWKYTATLTGWRLARCDCGKIELA